VVSQAPADRGRESAGSCGLQHLVHGELHGDLSRDLCPARWSGSGPEPACAEISVLREYRPLPASAGDDPSLQLFRADSLAAARPCRNPVVEHPMSRSAQLLSRARGTRGTHCSGSPGLCRGSPPGTDHLRAADTHGPGPGYVRDGPGQQRGHLLLAVGFVDVLVDPRCPSTGHRRCRRPKGRNPRGLGRTRESPVWPGRTRDEPRSCKGAGPSATVVRSARPGD